jgi:hypothetical protein
MVAQMQETTTLHPHEINEVKTPLILWKESVGKVFKLISKSYGNRNVTYTKIKSVREAETPGQFDIEVACAEFTARVLNEKRAHSSGCKEGVIHQDEDSILMPGNFGEECLQEEFDEISAAVMVHATINLDLVLQRDPEDVAEIEVSIDFPHLKVDELEASLLRNSPFLVKNVYLLSINSLKAAFESINMELQRASRNTRLTDACDPVYVEHKNDVITALRNKLANITPEILNHQGTAVPAQAAPQPPPPAPPAATPVFQRKLAAILPEPDISHGEPESSVLEPRPAATTVRRLTFTLLEKKSNIVLALRGKPSAATLLWEIQNPSKEGPVFRIGKESGLLKFVGWAHVSGRTLSEDEAAGQDIRTFFEGPDSSYTGPDPMGIHPLLKLEA